MTPAKFTSWVRWKTRTNSTTFTDAQLLLGMEVRQYEIAKAILKADEDILLIPQTCDLVEDQREYPQPLDIISRIKRVEAKLNGTNWIPLSEIDITQIGYPIATETNITDVFNNSQVSNGNPTGARFDLLRKAIMIYSGSITDVTAGLRIYVNTYPSVITDLTGTTDMSEDPSDTTHGIPKALHEIWSRGVIIDYKEGKEKPIPLSEKELSYKFDLEKAIEILKHGNLDREVFGTLPPASDRGNDGSDY